MNYKWNELNRYKFWNPDLNNEYSQDTTDKQIINQRYSHDAIYRCVEELMELAEKDTIEHDEWGRVIGAEL